MIIRQLFNEGLHHTRQGNQARAYECWTTLIDQLEPLRKNVADFELHNAQAVNLLANAYYNRGVLHNNGGHRTASCRDYDAAIAIREQLRPDPKSNLPNYTYWLAKNSKHLAELYNNRGILRHALGDLRGSLADYHVAIKISERLRPDPTKNPSGYAAWLARYGNVLAHAYNNRGLLKRDSGNYSASRRDYDVAIRIGEQLRPHRTNNPVVYSKWLLREGNALASAYNNRGLLRTALGDSAGSRRDYDESITIRESLRQHLSRQHHANSPVRSQDWLLQYANELASVYNNRGILRNALGDTAGACRDYDEALLIRKDLCALVIEKHGLEHWLVQYGNDLARVYSNRGGLRQALADQTGCRDNYLAAKTDYDAAIELRQALCPHLAIAPADYVVWLVQYANDLAITYSNRGLLQGGLGEFTAALDDHNMAIALRLDLRKNTIQRQGYSHWLARYGNDLALAYSNRGILRRAMGDSTRLGRYRTRQNFPPPGRITVPLYRLVLPSPRGSLSNTMTYALRSTPMPVNC